jgi:hypothetical protein
MEVLVTAGREALAGHAWSTGDFGVPLSTAGLPRTVLVTRVRIGRVTPVTVVQELGGRASRAQILTGLHAAPARRERALGPAAARP